MQISKTMRKIGWVLFWLMWIPFLTLFSLPAGEYGWSELPQVPRIGLSISGVLCGTSTLLLVGAPIISALRNRSILADGVPASAKILEISDTGTTINNNPVVRLLLEVQPDDRMPFQSETERLISRLEVAQYQPGQVVQVKFDPDSQEVALAEQ